MAESLPSELSRVDPADAWKPWRPSAATPWDRKWVAHLYRRAAFGPSPAETDRALADGFETTLDRLMTGQPDAPALQDLFADAGEYFKDPLKLRAWWLYVMLEGKHPLREKLTLFWHNHFATSFAKVQRVHLMFEQNLTLRKHALGKFRPFLLDMSKDTAMLKWLDSNQNIRSAPNENYAREVMELFSLGVGNYTEKDIQEAARAFTGWHADGQVNRDEDAFEFKPEYHDAGPKTVFGQTGNWGGEDVVRLCCDRPACGRFLVGKLYAFLVSETAPPKGLLVPLENRFRASDYDIADLVKTMLGSRLFFSAHAYRKRVKWPVEYALGAVRGVTPGLVPLADLVDPLAKMGQTLFAPPNVKGWRTGTDWLNSATLLARNNFAETVATGNWPRISTRGGRGGATFAAVAPPTAPVADVAEADTLMFAESSPGAPSGAPRLVGPADQVQAAAGAFGAAPVYVATPPVDGLPPGGPSGGAGSAPVPKGPAPAPAPPPPPEAKFDPTEVLFKSKPASVAALVKRMGELLYGEEVSPAARGKIEKFLLDGKKTLGEKDLDSVAFRQRAREALHALMCLPEYQLN
ncbi:MAG: hypothetical protein JWO38_7390 [Gemmataceae bacterium]|nr:hypothetical protein [Gemmataceae bacterium]